MKGTEGRQCSVEFQCFFLIVVVVAECFSERRTEKGQAADCFLCLVFGPGEELFSIFWNEVGS